MYSGCEYYCTILRKTARNRKHLETIIHCYCALQTSRAKSVPLLLKKYRVTKYCFPSIRFLHYLDVNGRVLKRVSKAYLSSRLPNGVPITDRYRSGRNVRSSSLTYKNIDCNFIIISIRNITFINISDTVISIVIIRPIIFFSSMELDR